MYSKITNPDDLWQPSPYVRGIYEASLQSATMLNSGLVRGASTEFNGQLSSGGTTLTLEVLPSDLTGDSEPLVPGRTSTPQKVTSGSQVAAVYDRHTSWGIEELAAQRAGTNVLMNDLGQKFGRWLATDYEREVNSLLKGVFGPLTWADGVTPSSYPLGNHCVDALADDSPGTLTPAAMRKAKNMFGYFSNRLSMVIIHSHVHHWLQESYATRYGTVGATPVNADPNRIGADGLADIWQGMRIVVSDAVETQVVGGKTRYATYITAPGVIITAEQADLQYKEGGTHLAWDRTVQFRWSDVVHLDGISWVGGEKVTNGLPRAQLSNPSNWSLIYDHRNVPIVRLTTELPA